jgi:Rrf2 family protein
MYSDTAIHELEFPYHCSAELTLGAYAPSAPFVNPHVGDRQWYGGSIKFFMEEPLVESALRISEAAGLAIHAVTIIARKAGKAGAEPIKISRLAELLNASEAHLGKVMHRLALAKMVTSKRGPDGGFVLGKLASKTTLLDIYEMFDGPLGHTNCLLGYRHCPFGGCALGDAITVANERLRSILGGKALGDLTPPPIPVSQRKERKAS